ncbi:MAG TPA: trypsin-like peptidase domain-containing protein [Acidimicrobiales bacterium]|nr:trypsin-like peptidase domain-containing protein [Acidimicrobiales bacterium]
MSEAGDPGAPGDETTETSWIIGEDGAVTPRSTAPGEPGSWRPGAAAGGWEPAGADVTSGYGASTGAGYPPGEPGGHQPPGGAVWAPPPPARPEPSRPRRWWLAVAAVAAVVGAAAGAGVGYAASRTNATTVVEAKPGTGALATPSGQMTIPQIVNRVEPAVVSIHTTAFQSGGFLSGGGLVQGAGTGMIISADGDVLTNNHVIAGASTLAVTLFNQTKSNPATVVAADPQDDIALVHIQGVSNLPTVTFGNSDAVTVGDGLVAIGNALDLGATLDSPTVTSGIVSATGRSVQTADPTTGASESLSDMIQTDAAINPGNSGGPLLDAQAQVIGMNTAVAGSSGDGTSAQNIGFAIPINKIKPILAQMRSGQFKATNRAFIGVAVVDMTNSLRQQYGFTPQQGAVVAQVTAGSPAASAGIQVGDVITKFDGTTITGSGDLTAAVSRAQAGHDATIVLYRGSQQMTVHLTLGTKPPA